MSTTSIARNYAEALFSLGEASGQTAEYAQLIDALADAIELSPEVKEVMHSPRVPKMAKARVLTSALAGAPRDFTRFVQAVVQRGRQGIVAEIAREYMGLVDVKLNRVRAAVTLVREPDEALRRTIQQALSEALGKEVLPTFTADPAILGGTIVRVRERIYDGSVRRRMARLRRHLLA